MKFTLKNFSPRRLSIVGLVFLLFITGLASAKADDPYFDGDVTPLEGSVLLRFKPVAQFERKSISTTTVITPSPESEILTSVQNGEIWVANGHLEWRIDSWEGRGEVDPQDGRADVSVFVQTTDRGELLEIALAHPSNDADQKVAVDVERFVKSLFSFSVLPQHPIEQGDDLLESVDFSDFLDGLGLAGLGQDANFDMESIVVGTAIIDNRHCLISEISGDFSAAVNDLSLTATVFGYTATDIATALVVDSHIVIDMSATGREESRARMDMISSLTLN